MSESASSSKVLASQPTFGGKTSVGLDSSFKQLCSMKLTLGTQKESSCDKQGASEFNSLKPPSREASLQKRKLAITKADTNQEEMVRDGVDYSLIPYQKVCPTCNGTFGNALKFRCHGCFMKSKFYLLDGRSIQTGLRFKCPECEGAIFKSSEALGAHIVMKHFADEDSKYQCKQCPSKFLIKKEIESHCIMNHRDVERGNHPPLPPHPPKKDTHSIPVSVSASSSKKVVRKENMKIANTASGRKKVSLERRPSSPSKKVTSTTKKPQDKNSIPIKRKATPHVAEPSSSDDSSSDSKPSSSSFDEDDFQERLKWYRDPSICIFKDCGLKFNTDDECSEHLLDVHVGRDNPYLNIVNKVECLQK